MTIQNNLHIWCSFSLAHFYLKDKYCPWPQTVLFFFIMKKMLNCKYYSLEKRRKVEVLLVTQCCRFAVEDCVHLWTWLIFSPGCKEIATFLDRSDTIFILQHAVFPWFHKQIFAKEKSICTHFPCLTLPSGASCEKKSFSIPLVRREAADCHLTVVVLKDNLLGLFL